MKRLENVKSVECYVYDNEHSIDIIETDETFEAWLYKKNYGLKTYMFGIPLAQQSKEDFIEIVTANVSQYLTVYYEEVNILEQERGK